MNLFTAQPFHDTLHSIPPSLVQQVPTEYQFDSRFCSSDWDPAKNETDKNPSYMEL